jgi:hypothetical protein
MRNYPDLGIQIGNILLPNPNIDLKKWAVIACDQFTSQPEYWKEVEKLIGKAPSTYHLILPEVFLESPDEPERIRIIQAEMRSYLDENIFNTQDGLILVERQSINHVRHGLILSLDLEHYDFSQGSQSLIRATEGTILERIPPRMRIREGASLELPHILVLIDDPDRKVIEPFVARKQALPQLYETELMLGSGRISAYAINGPKDEANFITSLRSLSDPQVFQNRYGVSPNYAVLLFAMGDGNHSLATAKSIWEKVKADVGMDHPSRYALVEIENVHDEGLVFEPIHRIVFGIKEGLPSALARHLGKDFRLESCPLDEMVARVNQPSASEQYVGCLTEEGAALLYFTHPVSNLPVGNLQIFLDAWLKEGNASRVDYVHGEEIIIRLGRQNGNAGFYLPAMAKDDLFKTVILDGALPRKTFSMGSAVEKRFYLEARKII